MGKRHGNIKCDCGHTAKYHHCKEGQCKECGCTWFYPNVKYILAKRKNK